MKQAMWLVWSRSERGSVNVEEPRAWSPHRVGGDVAPVRRAPSKLALELVLGLFVLSLGILWPALVRAEVFYLVCSLDAEHESTTLKIDTVAKTVDDKKADIDDKKIERVEQIGTTTIDRATGDITFGYDPMDGKHYEMKGKCVKRPNK